MSIDAPETPTQDPRQRRHSMRTVTLARTMHENGGWTSSEIAKYLTRMGTPVAVGTVRCWTNPEYLEKAHARHERNEAANAKFRLQGKSEAYRLAFMRRLRGEGVSYTGIAAVCRVVFGVSLVGEQVRWMLNETAA
jgi:hypothetical protein